MSTAEPEFYQAPRFTPEPPQAMPRQRGCFFYGCIIASILAVLFVIIMTVIAFVGYRMLSQAIDQYTSTTPRELPKVQMSEEQLKALEERVEAFRKAVEAGNPIEPLVLNSDELNALIEKNPELKGVVYVKIDKDEVKGQVSIPLDRLDFGMVRGRYLNGEADFKASLADGVLIVTLESVEVNGQKVPEQYMKEIRKQNVAKDFDKDEENARLLRKLESLEVKDGKVILKVRAKAGASSDRAASKKGAPVEIEAPPSDGAPKKEPPRKDEPPKTEPPRKDEPPKTDDEPKARTPSPAGVPAAPKP